MKTVILHGLGQTPRDWREVIGQTRSPVECPALFDQTGCVNYEKLLAGLDARYGDTSEPLRLCGLSLGALLALDLAIRHPGKVASLVLIAGQPRSPTLLIDLQNLIFRCLPEKMFRDMGLAKRDTIQLAHSMRRLDFSGQLHQVLCSAAVVCGEGDRANLGAAKKLARLLPKGELHIISDAGHEVNRDAPLAIAELLDR